jgi:hypothetical protein
LICDSETDDDDEDVDTDEALLVSEHTLGDLSVRFGGLGSFLVRLRVDSLEELVDFCGDFRGRSAGPIFKADLRKSLFGYLRMPDVVVGIVFVGDSAFVGAGGGFSGDFCLTGDLCLTGDVLVADGFGELALAKLISLTLAARAEIFSSFFSGTSLLDDVTLGSRLVLDSLPVLYLDEVVEYLDGLWLNLLSKYEDKYVGDRVVDPYREYRDVSSILSDWIHLSSVGASDNCF